MQEKNYQNAIFVLNRIKKALDIKTDSELALRLDRKQNTVATWKSRGTLDYLAIISLCDKHNIDLNHIFLDKKITSNIAADTPMEYNKMQGVDNLKQNKEFKDLIFSIIDEYQLKREKSDLLQDIADLIEKARLSQDTKKAK